MAKATKSRPKAARAAGSPTAKPATPVAPVLSCRFFKTDAGNEPVREWLQALPSAVRKEIGSDVHAVQWRWPVSKPLVDGFGGGLFEVRSTYDGNIYRVFFCVESSVMVLLHGFEKKTQRTPDQDLELARKRQKGEKE